MSTAENVDWEINVTEFRTGARVDIFSMHQFLSRKFDNVSLVLWVAIFVAGSPSGEKDQ